ncbi:MAG TPA: ABC transporter permease [Candidatus Krumholzibacteria bacterium]|nr:ABC transporter permease [Candidatus Krumholzibacteria bacterium]HPD71896.1 ABC transporter permease [Candidatus Krumholzibacteria bacterium]HRY41171.1 ABC transporter permease [Candidatus Krumholzibacteria bacterium]
MNDPARPAWRGQALLELTRSRVLEFVREPEAVFWVFVFPVLLAFALGIAFRSKPVERAKVAVITDGGAAATELAIRLRQDDRLLVELLTPDAAALALRKGNVDAVAELTAVADSLAVVYRWEPSRVEGRAARLALDDAIQGALGRADVVAVRDETTARPGSRYIDFLIPGLVGLNLMGSGMWGIGFSVVVARTRKLLKRFAATPMRRSDYLASFALSRLLFLGLEVAAVIGFGWLFFDVAVRGSLGALALVSLVGAASFAGLGLLVAARPRTVESVSGWMNLVMLPMWLLSGTFFSYERFPAAVLPAIRALPLTALNDALRAVMNDGASLWATGPELAILTAWGLGSYVVAVRIFRWQ